MNFDKLFQAQLDQLKEEGNYRIFAELQRKCGDFPKVRNHSDGQDEVTVWCSNDYLGMGHHPKVIEAMITTVEECGTGAGGTRNISGNAWHHKRLEAELADLHHKEDALLFTSGYVSNWAALSTLGSRLPNAVILSDELNHASMIEGIRHARCQKVIWKHNDPEDLDRKLAALPANATKIVAFESVYSMDGDIARSRRSSTSATSTARCPISTRSTRSACTARAAAVSRSARG
jgi:5-aminolevulinate synthase